jgi:drug/metabolite transporter (DMT)-like permease
MKAHLALFVVALIYGANYSIAKVVLDPGFVQPFAFILFRVLAGFIAFQVVHLLWVKEKIKKKDIGRLALCGLFGVAINQLCFFVGLKLTNPINAALIMTTTPILVLIAGAILIGEHITSKKIIGIIVGGGGAVMLTLYGKQLEIRSDQLMGDLLILVNALSFGLYLVLVRSLMQKYHPITVVKWIFSFGLLYVLPFGWEQVALIEWQSFTSKVWLSFIYVLLFTTVLTYLLNAIALSTVQASTASTYIYLQPLLASMIAIFFFDATLEFTKILSGGLIFIGVYLVSSKR